MKIVTIITLLFIIFILVSSAFKMNSYSGDKYDYEPFNPLNMFGMSLATVLMILSILSIPDGASLGGVLSTAIDFSIPEEHVSLVTFFASSCIISFAIYLNLIFKTSIFLATYCIFLMGFVCLLVILVFFAWMANDEKQRT